MKILIVEDSQCKLQTIEDVLIDKGLENYEVASNGERGMKKSLSSEYDLVILDLGFSWSNEDDYEEKMGLKFLLIMESHYRRKRKSMPSVIIFSKTYVKDDEIFSMPEIFGKAEDRKQLEELVEKWRERQKSVLLPKVLIVEDNQEKFVSVAETLNEIGITNFNRVESCMEAKLKFFNKYDYNLIITDMKLPYHRGETSHIEATIEFINEIESSRIVPLPKVIVYSCMPNVEKMWNGKLPKCYCGQAVFPYTLKELIQKLVI